MGGFGCTRGDLLGRLEEGEEGDLFRGDAVRGEARTLIALGEGVAYGMRGTAAFEECTGVAVASLFLRELGERELEV